MFSRLGATAVPANAFSGDDDDESTRTWICSLLLGTNTCHWSWGAQKWSDAKEKAVTAGGAGISAGPGAWNNIGAYAGSWGGGGLVDDSAVGIGAMASDLVEAIVLKECVLWPHGQCRSGDWGQWQ